MRDVNISNVSFLAGFPWDQVPTGWSHECKCGGKCVTRGGARHQHSMVPGPRCRKKTLLRLAGSSLCERHVAESKLFRFHGTSSSLVFLNNLFRSWFKRSSHPIHMYFSVHQAVAHVQT